MEAFPENPLLFENLTAPAIAQARQIKPWASILFFVLAALFLAVATRQGHGWGDDHAMYIHHAKNIAEGTAYGATGYVYNPAVPNLGPATYPPVFPLVLAPFYKLFGLNLDALKLVEPILLWLLLLLFYWLWRDELTPPQLLGVLALFAFNPLTQALRDCINSDVLFLCWLGLVFLLVRRVYEQGRPIVNQHVSAALLGTVIYLAYGTRSIGIILLGCLVLYDLWHLRRVRWLTLEIIGLAVGLIVLQNLFIHSDGTYANTFAIHPRNVLSNIRAYVSEFSAVWGLGFPKLLRLGLFGGLFSLAAWGWYYCARQRVTFLALFSLCYLPPILLISLEVQTRYLAPLMLPFLFYALRGGQQLLKHVPLRATWAQPALALLALLMLAGYAVTYVRMDWHPYNVALSRNETQQLTSYLRETTAPSDVLVFIKPRLLALLTDRRVSVWHTPDDEQALWDYLQKIGAQYVIAGPRDVQPESQAYLEQFLAHRADSFQALYANADYRVYRLLR